MVPDETKRRQNNLVLIMSTQETNPGLLSTFFLRMEPVQGGLGQVEYNKEGNYASPKKADVKQEAIRDFNNGYSSPHIPESHCDNYASRGKAPVNVGTPVGKPKGVLDMKVKVESFKKPPPPTPPLKPTNKNSGTFLLDPKDQGAKIEGVDQIRIYEFAGMALAADLHEYQRVIMGSLEEMAIRAGSIDTKKLLGTKPANLGDEFTKAMSSLAVFKEKPVVETWNKGRPPAPGAYRSRLVPICTEAIRKFTEVGGWLNMSGEPFPDVCDRERIQADMEWFGYKEEQKYEQTTDGWNRGKPAKDGYYRTKSAWEKGEALALVREFKDGLWMIVPSFGTGLLSASWQNGRDLVWLPAVDSTKIEEENAFEAKLKPWLEKGFTRWDGGKTCPVSNHVRVEYVLRYNVGNLSDSFNDPVTYVYWDHKADDPGYDIVAYKFPA